MRSALALVVLGGVAYASPGVPIEPPSGWTVDPTLAPAPAAERFGGKVTKVSVWAYRAPTPGAVLYVNRAEAELEAADRDRLASLELAEPRNALRRQGAAATAEQDTQQFDPATKQLEARVTWRDASVIDATRVVIAADATRAVAVTGQCVLAADVAPAVRAACEGALATLDPEVPAASRVPLAIVGAEMPDAPQLPSAPVLDDGGKVGLPPIVVAPSEPERDRRPIYLGAGLVALAALAWWNRKRREKFEDENPREDGPKPAGRRDEDDDALHAAAEARDDGDKQ